MKYVGNAYGKEITNSSEVSAEVAAQCYCGTQTCDDKHCGWN